MSESAATGATSAGERLLRSREVAEAAAAVADEVRQQLAAALHGPVGTALAAGAGAEDGALHAGHSHGGGEEGPSAGEAQVLLGSPVPRTFIATGAALTTGYVALSAGDDVRVAGALLTARELLFPDDPLGAASFAGAARPPLDALSDPRQNSADPAQLDAAALVQRRVAADVELLERTYLGAAIHLEGAALESYSWKQATGGQGAPSGALRGPLGPFLDGLVRWAFYVEAALDGIRRDDWARAGAALIAARRVTSQ